MPKDHPMFPFSEKSLFSDRISGKNQISKIPLILYLNINWHWGFSRRAGEPYFIIKRDYQALITKKFDLFSTNEKCIKTNQPTWNMDEYTTLGIEHDDGEDHEKAETENCAGWRMEHLAYYCPAHYSNHSAFGIHITKRGVAKIAESVSRRCPEQPLEIIQIAAFYLLVAHEMCHAWIEDICSIHDFANFERRAKSSRQYAKTHKEYGSYIFMEEAICNTAAYGWLRTFLFTSPSDGREKDMPVFNDHAVLRAFVAEMRSQPKGYRDFIEIDDEPPESGKLAGNIARLLCEVYEIMPGARRRGKDVYRDWEFREVESLVEGFFSGNSNLYIGEGMPLYLEA
jgi:hypothetical protein